MRCHHKPDDARTTKAFDPATLVGIIERAWPDALGVMVVISLWCAEAHKDVLALEQSGALDAAGLCLTKRVVEAELINGPWGKVIAVVRGANARHLDFSSHPMLHGSQFLRQLALDEEPDATSDPAERHPIDPCSWRALAGELIARVGGDHAPGSVTTPKVATDAVTQTVVTAGVLSSANTPRTNVSILTTTAITTVGGRVLVEAAVPVEFQKFADAAHTTASALATMYLERVSDGAVIAQGVYRTGLADGNFALADGTIVLSAVDTPAAGSWTYRIRLASATVQDAGTTVSGNCMIGGVTWTVTALELKR